MTALLTDNLPLLAGAPNGIKKLRELILELAVRGKLVPQDPSDEPASELLKRIAEEKARLVTEGKIKRIKQEPDPSGESETFDKLPCGWSQIAGQEIFIPRSGNSKLIKGKLFDSPAPDRYPGYSASGQDVWLESWEHDGTAIIISAVGARCGKAFLASGKWSAIANTHIVWPLSLINEHYAMLILNNENYWIRSGGAQPFIKVGDTLFKKIALPPLAEQHRIIAKVDELMVLCDRLETQQADAESAHTQLVQALLDSLPQASDATEFAANWQRLAEHFHTLFTTESSIDALKQTLLQLAVMGKLVPQDPNDEPASELLKRIQSEKQRLMDDGKLKKQKPPTEITEDEELFITPQNWQWARMSSFSELKSGFAYKSETFRDSGNNQVIRMGNVRPGLLRLDANPAFISDELARETSDCELGAGDIVLTMTGTKGKQDYMYSVLITDQHLERGRLYLNQRLCIVKAHLVNTGFLSLMLKDERLLEPIFKSSTGTANQANIGMAALGAWALPLPPLAEQHRIVAKVDQLMALCDQLRTRLTQARQLNEQLASTLVEQAVA